MPTTPVSTCFFSGRPVIHLPEPQEGYAYALDIDGHARVIRLAPGPYATDPWWAHNCHRILEKVQQNNHWHILRSGLTFAQLTDYLVAPAHFGGGCFSTENERVND
jgi:hypothetical protein